MEDKCKCGCGNNQNTQQNTKKTDSNIPEELKKTAAKNRSNASPLDNHEMETALRNAGISW